MIRNLHISNYALIEELDIEFAPGFNIITGETGAGKSIILGALSLLLGGRADQRAVRDTGRKSVIEAVFGYSKAPAVATVLAANELDGADACECILRREILPGGRSRAFVNDTPVNLGVLRDVAVHLVDIHSQHQNLLLASADYQLDIIDTLAGSADLLAEYGKAFAEYKVALKEYKDTREMILRSRADAEFISFQFSQLDGMNLLAGEDEALERERELLTNLSEIKSKIRQAADPLSDSPSNALGELHRAVAALENLAVTLGDPGEGETNFHILAERLESARVEIADIADTLADYDLSLDADPGRLLEVEERLGQIYSLESKHHAASTDELIAIRDRLGAQLAALDDSDATLGKLEGAARRAKKNAVGLAERLSELRATTAAAFSQELRAKAATLGMPNLRCEITLTRGKLGPSGFDQIQFLFAFNKNQALTPVGATASGGEISRLMLTVKSIVASRMQLPSIIFDEVDTGVSGDIAARMADMMQDISNTIQVITITHLPGVAAMGSRHFKVYKEDDEKATTTRVQLLSPEERIAEIALMLGGDASDSAALAAADALIKQAASRQSKM